MPWKEVAAAIKDTGYDGPVVIESFTDKVKTIARAAAIWRSFETSQDALAQNGLKFLRGLSRGSRWRLPTSKGLPGLQDQIRSRGRALRWKANLFMVSV